MNVLKRARMLKPVPSYFKATHANRIDPYSITDLQIPPIKTMIPATTMYGMQPGMMHLGYQQAAMA